MNRFTKDREIMAAASNASYDSASHSASHSAAKGPNPATVPAAWPTGLSQLVQTVGAYRQGETGEVSGEVSGDEAARTSNQDSLALNRGKLPKQPG
jgi:hypothetical protein